MDKIIFLGTGAGSSTKFYNACFLFQKDSNYMLVDGGGGIRILDQLEKANIPFKAIRNIFVTHNHIDHITGIIWLIRKICIMMRENQYEGDVDIYASDVTIDAIRMLSKTILAANQSLYVDDRIHLHVVKDREEKNILGDHFTFYDIKATKEKQYGFRIDMENGKSLVCNGDETFDKENEYLAKNVDFFIHEAFCLESEKEKKNPYKIGHATTKDVCAIANELHVKNLILYHIASKDVVNRKKRYLEENKEFFSGNLFVPNDFEEIQILKENNKYKPKIVITGAVLGSTEDSTHVYEKLVNMIDHNKYDVHSPLDTMKFVESDEERYQRAMQLLSEANFIIAEMSTVSCGQGMELQEAIHREIPILVIAKTGSKISGLVKGCGNLVDIIYYDKIEEVKNKVLKYI